MKCVSLRDNFMILVDVFKTGVDAIYSQAN